jgi:hypothetical protein
MRELFLVREFARQTAIHEAEVLLSMKANMIDRTSADEIQKFNDLFNSYKDLLIPENEVPKKTLEDSRKVLKEFQEKFFLKRKKVPNFEQVKDGRNNRI